MKYTDPDGRWFFIDDMLYSFLAILFDNQESNWWQGTIDSFIHSWKHPIEHGKMFYSFFTLFFTWTDLTFGLESYDKWHMQLTRDTEIRIELNISSKKLTLFFRKRKSKTNVFPKIDLPIIKEDKKDEKVKN